MSRTSLGQRPDMRQRQDASTLKQVQSVRRVNYQEEYFQTHVKIYEEVEYFLHMKERYLKVEKENRFFDLDNDSRECYSNVKDGYGINIFKNGDRYIGFWEKNTMHGMGIYVFKSLDSTATAYLGEFHYGKFHGLGKLVKMLDDQNGEIIYRGTWVDGKKSEQGIYFYENPHVYYQGSWLKDEKSGDGKLIFTNGEYIGQWKNNVRHGQGRLKKIDIPNNSTLIYQGLWDSDELQEGEIVYMDSNGNELSRYKGSLHNGKKHGNGTYSWKNGSFTGIFEEDKIKGEGTLKTSQFSLSGFFYSNSDVIQDTQNLLATLEYSNKDTYEGTVSIKQGKILRDNGLYRFSNGDTAEGHFTDNPQGKLQGSFHYLWANGAQSNF